MPPTQISSPTPATSPGAAPSPQHQEARKQREWVIERFLGLLELDAEAKLKLPRGVGIPGTGFKRPGDVQKRCAILKRFLHPSAAHNHNASAEVRDRCARALAEVVAFEQQLLQGIAASAARPQQPSRTPYEAFMTDTSPAVDGVPVVAYVVRATLTPRKKPRAPKEPDKRDRIEFVQTYHRRLHADDCLPRLESEGHIGEQALVLESGHDLKHEHGEAAFQVFTGNGKAEAVACIETMLSAAMPTMLAHVTCHLGKEVQDKIAPA